MGQFDQPPQTPQQPKYTPAKLAEYLRDTNGALSVSLRVLVRGMEVSADPEVYKPWPKVEVQKSLASILALLESNVKYYQGAGESEKARETTEKIEQLKNVFSVMDNSEELPEDFLQAVQQAVGGEINFSNNMIGAEQSAPAGKTVEKEHSREKMNGIADLIDELIQAYAKILRAKVEENSASREPESVKLHRIKVLQSIIANLEKTQTTFLHAFNEFGALEMDEATLSDIIQATVDTGKKLEQIGF